MSGRKRSRVFAITFNHVEWDKTCFGEWLVNAGLSNRVCIGEEKHSSQLDPLTGEYIDIPASFHHHCYVEFIEPHFLPEVRDVVLEFLGQEDQRSINIQVGRFD